jgi:CRP-like cAMP-binding protein
MARLSNSSASGPRSLARIELFAGVKEATLHGLERRCTWRWWEPGSVVLARDSFSENVYFVTAGLCCVQAITPSDHRVIVLGEIEPGGFFGEFSVIDGEPRSANILAVRRTYTAELEGRFFLDFIAANPAIALRLMRRLTEILRQADLKIMELAGLDAQARICAELLRRARKGGGLPPKSAVVRPMPPHYEIAAWVSTTRETVARVLSSLSRCGLVGRDDDGLVIYDVNALSEMVVASESR